MTHKTAMRQSASRRSTRGIVLVEVLVAILIFMLGVLGLVGLKGAMTRAQSDAKYRADAAYLATEGVGRLWTDLGNIASYGGDGCKTQARCQEWLTKIAATLPGGTGAFVVDAVSGDVSVTVSWQMPNGSRHQYVSTTTVAKRGG